MYYKGVAAKPLGIDDDDDDDYDDYDDRLAARLIRRREQYSRGSCFKVSRSLFPFENSRRREERLDSKRRLPPLHQHRNQSRTLRFYLNLMRKMFPYEM